jgi:hypothetical protein
MNIEWTKIPKDAEVDFNGVSWRYNGACVFWGGEDAKQAQDFLIRHTRKEVRIDPDISADDALKICTIQGQKLFLPDVQLKNYAEIKQILTKIGGKWSTKEQCFIFADDNPKVRIDNYLQTGKKTSTKKEQQAFFTPDAVADRLVELLQIEEGMDILEPCAGKGAIVRAIKRAFTKVNVECIEIHEPYAKELSDAGANGWEVNDFLTVKSEPRFHRILMNPPYAKNAPKQFINKAFECLDTHGLLGVILPLGKGKRLLEDAGFVDIDVEELPEKSFAESGTNINTEIVFGRKPYDS